MILLLNQSLRMLLHSLRHCGKNEGQNIERLTDGRIWKCSPKAPPKAENGFLLQDASS